MTVGGRAAERRAHLIGAVLDLIDGGGIPAVSMRAVAAAAGVSLAQVQYYFRSKEQLIVEAFRHICRDVEERAAAVGFDGPARSVLRALIDLWLPVDERLSRDARVWLAFSAEATTRPSLMSFAAEVDEGLREAFAQILRRASESGELNPAADPVTAAAGLLAVIDGLVVQSLVLDESERAGFLGPRVEAHLDLLFPKAQRKAKRSKGT
ncbi:TetR family transcriptional regulator C-terminal domain-containing protein [Saccharopolyspora sp. NPDC050642]|uniref:TetR/AcrR family transcriptional regulator n=1 Tax=Saccharopolyspora sp. NPDC050642 TaxID=3157099 RepID=UPI0033E84326